MTRILPPVAPARIPLRAFLHALMATVPTSASGSVEVRRQEFRDYFGVSDFFFVSSGKAALTLTLLAMKSLSPRRKVILPAYTCFSVPAAVVRAGLTVVLCDVDPKTFDFYPDRLARLVDEETLCVVVAHLFGIPADVDGVRSVCNRHGAFVVEDAAQAMGGTSGGKKLGTKGDVGIFSLGRGKNLTCGSGGIVVTNHGTLAPSLQSHYDRLASEGPIGEGVELLKCVGMALLIHPRFYSIPASLPWLKLGETFFDPDFEMATLSKMKRGLLWDWQERLDESNRTRAKVSDDYLRRLDLTTIPAGTPCLRLPMLLPDRAERDRLYGEMKPFGVGKMYPTPLHQIPEFSLLFDAARYPGAEEIAERLLTLPTHRSVSEQDREQICRALRPVKQDATQVTRR